LFRIHFGSGSEITVNGGSLKALAEFGSEGAALARWHLAAARAKGTFYKSRDRLVEAGRVRFDGDNARYIAVEPSGGPGPEPVQNGSNLVEVQEVSPVSPL
jgi:hypothetical protein